MKLTYTEINGYLIPDLILPETDTRPIGKYGELRRQFLQEHRPDLFDLMLLEGTLHSHLANVDASARQMVEDILRSETPRDLPRILRKMGYEVDFNPNHKYPTIKLPHDRRPVRFKTLGEEYTPQAMAQRIQQNHEIGIFKRMEIYNKRYPPVHPHYQKLRQDFRKAIMEAFGIYRTYLYYCYLLGKLPTTTPNYRPPHSAMREDYRRWAEIEKQLHLLERHSLNTAEDVAAFTSEQEQKLTDLETRRTKCRNRLRRCRDPTECEALHTEKDELTKQITKIRKELKTAQQIPSRVKRMRENIQLLNDREQQRAAHREER